MVRVPDTRAVAAIAPLAMQDDPQAMRALLAEAAVRAGLSLPAAAEVVTRVLEPAMLGGQPVTFDLDDGTTHTPASVLLIEAEV